MKKEKKRLNKKVLVFSLFLFALIVISIAMVAAAEGDPNLSFWQAWLQSQLSNSQAKIILLLMVSVILYALFYSLTDKGGISLILSIPIAFVLTVYVTPDQILGILRSYNTLPLMITSILPLIVLGMFTYFAIEKGKKSLMNGQLLVWWMFFMYLTFRLLAIWYAYAYSDTIATSTDLFDIAINSFASMPPPEQATTFWIAMFFQYAIAIAMTWKNGMVTGVISKSVESTQEAVADRNTKKVVNAVKELKKIEEGLEGGGGI